MPLITCTSAPNSDPMGEEDSSWRSYISRVLMRYLRDGEAVLSEKIPDRGRDQLSGFRNVSETVLRDLIQSSYDIFSVNLEAENPLFDPSEGTTVVEPQQDQGGYWAGALTAFRDEGEIYLCYRLRDPDERGRKAVITRTEGSEAETEKIWSVDQEAIGAKSIEGGTLYENNGVYRLYLSYQCSETEEWKIAVIPGESVESLDVDRAEDLEVRTGKYVNIKDPFVHQGSLYVHAATSNFLSTANFKLDLTDPGHDAVRRIEIEDAESSGSRLTSILSTEQAEIALYDWNRSIIFTGEEKSRFGNLSNSSVTPLLDGRKSLLSPHGSRSLRYVRAVPVADEVWFYYELSMPRKGHETRVYKASREDVESAVNGFLEEQEE